MIHLRHDSSFPANSLRKLTISSHFLVQFNLCFPRKFLIFPVNIINPLNCILVAGSNTDLKLLILALPFIFLFIKFLKFLPQSDGFFSILCVFDPFLFLESFVDFFDMFFIIFCLFSLLFVKLLEIHFNFFVFFVNFASKLLPHFQVCILLTAKEMLLIL